MGAELSSPTEAAAASAGRLPEAPQADAARTIQALWRSYLLRMDALDTVEELRQRRAVYQLLARVEESAAVKIQRAARRHHAEHLQQSSAAVLLQAALRGASARGWRKGQASDRLEEKAEQREALRRQRELESRVAVMIASGPHRFAMKIQPIP